VQTIVISSACIVSNCKQSLLADQNCSNNIVLNIVNITYWLLRINLSELRHHIHHSANGLSTTRKFIYMFHVFNNRSRCSLLIAVTHLL